MLLLTSFSYPYACETITNILHNRIISIQINEIISKKHIYENNCFQQILIKGTIALAVFKFLQLK